MTKELPKSFQDISNRIDDEIWTKDDADKRFNELSTELLNEVNKYSLETKWQHRFIKKTAAITLALGLSVYTILQTYNHNTYSKTQTKKALEKAELAMERIHTMNSRLYSWRDYQIFDIRNIQPVVSDSDFSKTIELSNVANDFMDKSSSIINELAETQKEEVKKLHASSEYNNFQNKKTRNKRILLIDILGVASLIYAGARIKNARNDKRDYAHNVVENKLMTKKYNALHNNTTHYY